MTPSFAPDRSPLKIGYLRQIDTIDLTGVSATALHMKAVISGLARRGHQVRTVTLPDGAYRWSDDLQQWHDAGLGWMGQRPFQLLESGIRRLQTTLKAPYLNLFDSARYAQAVRGALTGFDVLFERYWLMNYGGLLAANRLGVPLVLEVNGDIVEEYEQLGIELSSAQWAVIRAINRRLFAGAAHVITVSEPLRQRTIDRWRLDPAKVTAVDNGADVDLFANPQGVPAARARYGLTDAPAIMFVGTFKPWHGLDLLLAAFRLAAAAHPTARLVLVGDGPLRAEMAQTVAAWGLADRVVMTGVVPHADVAPLLGAADVAVLSPRVSGASISQSPLKLFEYMAAGKAVIAPAMPNVERVLQHGRNGLLVPPNDAPALSAAMLQLLQDAPLRQALGQAAQAQALARHSWAATAARIESILYASLDGASV